MIQSIHISDTASFHGESQALDGLSKFNFVFGSNGTGKTTLSRLIASEGDFPACRVNWKNGTKLQALVYNRDFVEKNFDQSEELRGVFTLGEDTVDTLNKIRLAKDEVRNLTRKIDIWTVSLHGDDGAGGKKGDLVELEASLKTKCWAQKQKHDAKLSGAFEGYRGSMEKFKEKILHEWTTNAAATKDLAYLEGRAGTVLGSTPSVVPTLPSLDTDEIIAHEGDPILSKRIVGKEDVDIAAMIERLGNSDWVRMGRTFYDANGEVCPFCQQVTKENFSRSLNEYFDETFEKDCNAIDLLVEKYESDAKRIQQQIVSIMSEPTEFIDVDNLEVESDLLNSIIEINIQRLASKKREPSQVVELESISNVVSVVVTLIMTANTKIGKHNLMVANISRERSDLTAQVWKYLLERELKADLETYRVKRKDLNKAIGEIEAKINTAMRDKKQKLVEIGGLEKQTTSIQPTINGINGILSSFGFQNFSLAKATGSKNYKLIRADGSDAKSTLSEGERNFVTFLYFYYLLQGSVSETGVTTDRVVVIDDPVSSLDSDIVFVVVSLIKDVFHDIRTGNAIKQAFVLTHNVYFHKEITFSQRRAKNAAMSEETFWVVRKMGLQSKVKKHSTNPISTSYELLWSEVRSTNRSNVTIQNTLRRILENYFQILGGIDFDKVCGMFEGRNKLICKSLISWIHDGSHHVHDDLYLANNDAMVEVYLDVFKGIFDKSGHRAHYEMMMGNVHIEDTTTVLST